MRTVAMNASTAEISAPSASMAAQKAPTPRKHWSIRGGLGRRQYVIYAIAGVLTPILLWAFFNEAAIVPKIFLPGPLDVARRFWSWILNEGFATDLAISVERVTLDSLHPWSSLFRWGYWQARSSPPKHFWSRRWTSCATCRP